MFGKGINREGDLIDLLCVGIVQRGAWFHIMEKIGQGENAKQFLQQSGIKG
ncbi:MAG: hypothetical protein ACLT33_10105 [Lachnospira pectinoschiza]